VISIRNIIILFLFTAALMLSGWSIFISNHNHDKKYFSHHDDEPDAYMENVSATIFNKAGTLSLKVTTPKLVHYVLNDTTYVLKPDVTIYRNSPKPWYINSDFAKSTGGSTQILFWEHVLIHHPADTQNPITTMETATLTVYPDKEIAATDQPVIIQQPDTIVHAIGMLANMNDGTVKLLSKAQGEYVPGTHQAN